MKFAILSAAVSLFAFATVSCALPAEGVEARQSSNSQCADRRRASPLYRSYNAQSVDHFYTISSQEATNAVNLGYAREGITGYLFASREPGTVAFYRLYNAAGADHLYTLSTSERDQTQRSGYAYEATYYIYPTRKCGAVALYRLYNAQGIDHFYTTSPQERDSAQGIGYQYEGIAGYVYPN